MTKLLTEKQQVRAQKYAIALKTFKEVDSTCIGSYLLKCQETSRRLERKGIKLSWSSIYNKFKNISPNI